MSTLHCSAATGNYQSLITVLALSGTTMQCRRQRRLKAATLLGEGQLPSRTALCCAVTGKQQAGPEEMHYTLVLV